MPDVLQLSAPFWCVGAGVRSTTDFSPVSTNAMNFATDMALAIDASILLFNSYNIPVSYSDVPVLLISVEEMKKSSEG